MGTSIHPDNPMPFGRLCPDMDGDQALRVFLALFPDPEIAERSHLVRRKIRLALMMPQRDAGRIVRQRPESACLVEWEAAVIGKLDPAPRSMRSSCRTGDQ